MPKPHPKIRVETRAPQACIRIRHVGPYNELRPVFQAVCAAADELGPFGPQTLVGGLAYDDPAQTPAAELRYDAFVTVDAAQLDQLDLQAPVERGEVPGGEYAVYRHRGPYEQLGAAYGELMGEWLPQSGRTPKDSPCVELYLNDVESTPPAELETLICLPLES